MKKIRKLMSSTLCFAFLLSILNVSFVCAETPDEKAILSQKVQGAIANNSTYIETSYQSLLDEAIDNEAPITNQQILEAAGSDDTLQVSTYKIQDEVIAIDTKSNSKLHALSYASVISPFRAGGHKYEEGSDGAYAVKAYSTLYYTTKDHSGVTMYCLTQVTGGYTKIVGVSVASQTVAYGMSGIGEGAPVNLSGTKYPSGTTFSYYTGFNSYVTTAASSYIGCGYTLNIRRGTGTYTFTLNNDL